MPGAAERRSGNEDMLTPVFPCTVATTWLTMPKRKKARLGGRAFWVWLRGLDLNQRPSGYEPDELPGCSTPRHPSKALPFRAAAAAARFREDFLLCVWQTWQRPTLPRLETQYHRRWSVSRPSSEWDRVQPLRHDHQVGKTHSVFVFEKLFWSFGARSGAPEAFRSVSFARPTGRRAVWRAPSGGRAGQSQPTRPRGQGSWMPIADGH